MNGNNNSLWFVTPNNCINGRANSFLKIASELERTLRKGITAPIVGPGKLEQLKTLLNSLSLKLSKKQILSLEKPYQPKNISGHI